MSDYERDLLQGARNQDLLGLEQFLLLEMCRLLKAILMELIRNRKERSK